MENSRGARYLAEFIGTYLLVFTVGCNVISGSPVWAALSIACVLMVSVYALGSVSGANFNPAVSLALGLTSKLPWQEVGIYMAIQIFGGIMGALSYMVMLGEVFTLGPSRGIAWWQAGLAEMFYTFMLCFVVLNVAASRKHADKDQFYGLAIGFVIVAGGYGAGHLSGGVFNPALAIGIDCSSAMLQFGWCVVYILFEFAGAGLAAVLYYIVRPDDFTMKTIESYTMQTKLVSEFIGTFMLVLTVGLNVIGKSPAGALSIAASLMSMVFALGSCSGAHFNPCVTAAIMATGRGKCPPREGALFVVTQLVAGICAGCTYSIMEGGKTFPLGPGPAHNWLSAGLAELIFTFVLCFVVLSVATTSIPLSQYFGLAIGGCIIVGGCAVGAVSGGVLNPAVAMGIAVPHLYHGGGLLGLLLYMGAQCAGAAIAAVAFMGTHPSEYKPSEYKRSLPT